MPLNLVCCKNWHAQCHIQCLRCHFCCKTVGLYYFGWGFSLSSRWGRVDKAVEDQLRENPSAWKVTNTRISELSQILPSVSPWSSCWQRVVGVQLKGLNQSLRAHNHSFYWLFLTKTSNMCQCSVRRGGSVKPKAVIQKLLSWHRSSWCSWKHFQECFQKQNSFCRSSLSHTEKQRCALSSWPAIPAHTEPSRTTVVPWLVTQTCIQCLAEGSA